MVLLNVIVFALSGVFGLAFLLQTLHRMTLAAEMNEAVVSNAISQNIAAEHMPTESTPVENAPSVPAAPLLQPAETPAWQRRSTRNVLQIWLIVFALVGAQMGWVLRPFIGHPGTPFSWFRPKQSNFFEAMVNDIEQLVGGESATYRRSW
jgi:hypothetical protein